VFTERKDAVEMALGIALLITALRWHALVYMRGWRKGWVVGELVLGLFTFGAVLLILLGTW
jgi:hypothetical protein